MSKTKLWYEDWEIITHALPMSLTVKEILLPNAFAQQRFTIMYGTKQDDIRDLTVALESALTELGKRASPYNRIKDEHGKPSS